VRLDSTFRLYDGKPGTPDAVTTGEAKLGLAQRICKETADEEQTGQTKRACEKMSALFFASGGTSFRSRDLGFPAFSLGGPLRLGAYGTNELLTNQYFLVQPAVLYKLWEISPILKQNVYLLGMYEAGKAFGPAGGGTVAQDGTAGVLLQTVFGPIFFGGSAGDRDHRKFFFKVGHFF
jgi:NTE family protein